MSRQMKRLRSAAARAAIGSLLGAGMLMSVQLAVAQEAGKQPASAKATAGKPNILVIWGDDIGRDNIIGRQPRRPARGAVDRFDALVDTGSGLLVLPSAWKERLGRLSVSQAVEMETADQPPVVAHVCGPVRIEVEGFRPIFSEVAFLEMHPSDGVYEPLLGYIILEQAGIAVDMLGHRLVNAKHMDLK